MGYGRINKPSYTVKVQRGFDLITQYLRQNVTDLDFVQGLYPNEGDDILAEHQKDLADIERAMSWMEQMHKWRKIKHGKSD